MELPSPESPWGRAGFEEQHSKSSVLEMPPRRAGGSVTYEVTGKS